MLLKGWNAWKNMQASLFMTYSFKFKISPQNNLQFISCKRSSSEHEIVNLSFCEGGKTLADKDLVISLYAYDGERRSSSAPPRRGATRRSPEEATGAPHDSSAAHIPVSWELGFRED